MPHLGGPRAKVERAREHLEELERRIKYFFESHPYRYGRQLDPQNYAYFIYSFPPHPAPPRIFAAIVGDIVHNLRSALDHVAWQLALQTTVDPKKTAFPIFSDTTKSSMRSFKRSVQFILPDSLAIIEALQPFHQGDSAQRDPLWILHWLWNADKHRLLTAVTYRLHLPLFSGPGGVFEELDNGTKLVRVPRGAEPEVNLEQNIAQEILLEILESKDRVPALDLLWRIYFVVGHEIVPFFTRYLPEPDDRVERESRFARREPSVIA